MSSWDDPWGTSGGKVSENDFDNGNAFDSGDAFNSGNDFDPIASSGGDNGNANEGGPGGSGGGCFNCGQHGHLKSECPNPQVTREFTGECNLCGQTGHRKADCPDGPRKACLNCLQEGHAIVDCTNARARENIWPDNEFPTCSAEEAWTEFVAAVADQELAEAKIAAHKYLKAVPDVTYPALEKSFRQLDVGVYLIAVEKEVGPTAVLMDTQGNLKKTYCVTWSFSPKPGRGSSRGVWPESAEINSERLADAGRIVDCLMPLCSNCNQLGHIKKSCTEDVVEISDRATIACFNCDEPGHRQRDCTKPRPDKFACRNCNQSGHNAKDCTEPRDMSNVECKKCQEKGHFASDCPTNPPCFNCGQMGHRKADCTNEKVEICRNCDEIGHISKDCPKPKDWSRVKCINCGENGHSKVKCKKPVMAEEAGSDFGAGPDSGANDCDRFDRDESQGNTFQNSEGYPTAAAEDDWGVGSGGGHTNTW